MMLLVLLRLLPLLLPPLLLLLLLLHLLLQMDQRCPRNICYIDFSFFVDIELSRDKFNLGSNNNQMVGSQPVSIFLRCLTATMRHNIIIIIILVHLSYANEKYFVSKFCNSDTVNPFHEPSLLEHRSQIQLYRLPYELAEKAFLFLFFLCCSLRDLFYQRLLQ